jgi:hypothetical protein
LERYETLDEIFLAFSCFALCSSAASAHIIYSNIGPGFPADSGGNDAEGNTYFSTTFIATNGGNLNTLTMELDGTTSPVTVGLYTNSAGQPGTLLESWTAVIPIGGGAIPPVVPATTLTSLVRPYLSAGTQYWIVLTQSSPFQIRWYLNDTGVTGGFWTGSTINTQVDVFPGIPTPGIQLTAGPATADAPFQVSYAANLNLGESYIDITNTGANGASLLGPGFGAAQADNICVNVYAFDPSEEMIACCSCLVTPDQTVNLGVNADLTVKTLTGVPETSVRVKLLASLNTTTPLGGVPGVYGCTNSAATVVTAAAVSGTNTVAPFGMAAWSTTLHPGATAGSSGVTTEKPFTPATLSSGAPGSNNELQSLTGRCAAIIGNASGYGICTSCQAGALGGKKL